MSRRDAMEHWLDTVQPDSFTNWQLAASAGITTAEASQWIQAYQDAQLHSATPTRYVIHRTGRTRAAVWHRGTSMADLRESTEQFADDVQYRVEAVISPLLDTIAAHNPRARKEATKTTLEIGRLVEKLTRL